MSFKKRFVAAVQAFGNPQLMVNPETLRQMVDGRVNTRLSEKRLHATLQAAVVSGLEKLRPQLSADLPAQMLALEAEWTQATPRWDRVRNVAVEALQAGGVTKGRMLEIGGRLNPRNKEFPAFNYHALDFENAPGTKGVTVMAGDITNCPHIPDNSFDFILSFDVFEHIDRPWLAAAEIRRLLRPGGVTVHSTLFSWRYHPCPIDYWRFTAEGLKSLFDLECLHSSFDYAERRRDVRGRGKNAMEPDALGGWRENVRVHYAGIKR